jgi:hypothetical protein
MYVYNIFSLCLGLSIVIGEITIVPILQTIYDSTPRLWIKGEGFDADEFEITIEIGSSTGSLRQDKHFILSKVEDGIVLKLLTSRKYNNNYYF